MPGVFCSFPIFLLFLHSEIYILINHSNMKKRLAKKALSGRYFDIWIKPGVDKELRVPRSGRCWYVTQRACYYWGHPEWIEEITKEILSAIEEPVSE